VRDDALVEAAEGFTVTLSAPQGATLGDAEASGTILDGSADATLVVNSSADPGDGGFATGGGGQGGPGGLGRIRVSVQSGRCSLSFASFNPSLADAMCSFSMGAGTPGTTFIRRYPD
jgi:hypothetical protein